MIKCKICGHEFEPIIDKHYISRDKGESGVVTVFKSTEGNIYDTFDCPSCGCQVIAQERKRAVVEIDYCEKEVEDDDEESEDESEQ